MEVNQKAKTFFPQVAAIWSRLAFRTKLVSSTAALLVLGLAAGVSGQYAVRVLFQAVTELSSASTAADWLGQAALARIEASQNIYVALAAHEVGKPPPDGTINDISSAFGSIESNLIKYDAELKAFRQPETQITLYKKAMANVADAKPAIETCIAALKAANLTEKELKPLASAASDKLLVVNDSLSELSGMIRQQGQDVVTATQSLAKWNVRMAWALSLCALVLGAVVSLFALRSSRLLLELLAQLRESSEHVAGASENLLTTGDIVSKGVVEQASALQQTAAAAREVREMVASTAEQASSASRSTKAAAKSAENGRAVMADLMLAMHGIEDRMRQLVERVGEGNREVGQVVKIIEEIGTKTNVINEIVFQTKLLSFNASVEAARAGDHGRGFSIVAEEVGQLARMSGQAAQEIKAMLESGKDRANEIVERTRSGVDRLVTETEADFKKGTSIAAECADALQEIVKSAAEVERLTESISRATPEQDRGISEIAGAMERLESLSADNQQAAGETTDSAHGLKGQVNRLELVIERLDRFVMARQVSAIVPMDAAPSEKEHSNSRRAA